MTSTSQNAAIDRARSTTGVARASLTHVGLYREMYSLLGWDIVGESPVAGAESSVLLRLERTHTASDPGAMIAVQLEVEEALAELDRLSAPRHGRTRAGAIVGVVGGLVSAAWLFTAIGFFTLVPVLLALVVGAWWLVGLGVDRIVRSARREASRRDSEEIYDRLMMLGQRAQRLLA